MLWTDNQIFGLSKIENKLSFILFPVLFRFSKINLNIRTIFSILLFGLFISLIFYESIGVYKSIYYPVVDHYNYLTGVKFTVFMHRGYFSLYLIIGIAICISRMLDKKDFTIHLLLYTFFTIGLFQTFSKAGVLCFIVVHIIYIIHTIINKWKTAKKKHMVFLIAISMIAILFSIKSVIVRIDKTIYALNHIKLEDNNSIESNQARLIMWNTSLKVIEDNFIYEIVSIHQMNNAMITSRTNIEPINNPVLAFFLFRCCRKSGNFFIVKYHQFVKIYFCCSLSLCRYV